MVLETIVLPLNYTPLKNITSFYIFCIVLSMKNKMKFVIFLFRSKFIALNFESDII